MSLWGGVLTNENLSPYKSKICEQRKIDVCRCVGHTRITMAKVGNGLFYGLTKSSIFDQILRLSEEMVNTQGGG